MQVPKSVLIVLIIAVCLASYFNTLFFMVQESIKHFPIPLRKSLKAIAEGDFLDFVCDDHSLIIDNPYIRAFKFLPLFFTHDIWNISTQAINSGYYRPLLGA